MALSQTIDFIEVRVSIADRLILLYVSPARGW